MAGRWVGYHYDWSGFAEVASLELTGATLRTRSQKPIFVVAVIVVVDQRVACSRGSCNNDQGVDRGQKPNEVGNSVQQSVENILADTVDNARSDRLVYIALFHSLLLVKGETGTSQVLTLLNG